jgi:hypothetical protein
MPNTLLHVCYRNAHDDKNVIEVILPGASTVREITDVIAPKLEEGVFFIPCQVGLPDAHFDLRNWETADHPFHTFGCRHSSELRTVFEHTGRQPTLGLSWRELVERFAGLSGWDTSDWPGHGTVAELPVGESASSEQSR